MIDLLQQLLGLGVALAAVLALAWLAIWLMKRFQLASFARGAGAASDLRFVRALPLGPRERLVVVEWRGETLLLGVTAGSVSVVDRRPIEPARTGEP